MRQVRELFDARALPRTLVVCGEALPLNSDFRVGLRVRMLWQDAASARYPSLFWKVTFRMLFGQLPKEKLSSPLFCRAAAEAVTAYLCGGRRLRAGAAEGKRVFSYFDDAPYVYAAFLSVYGLDLYAVDYLHLWRFDALFSALPADCQLMQILSVRSLDLSLIADETERERMAALQVLYRLPGGVVSALKDVSKQRGKEM